MQTYYTDSPRSQWVSVGNELLSSSSSSPFPRTISHYTHRLAHRPLLRFWKEVRPMSRCHGCHSFHHSLTTLLLIPDYTHYWQIYSHKYSEYCTYRYYLPGIDVIVGIISKIYIIIALFKQSTRDLVLTSQKENLFWLTWITVEHAYSVFIA